MEQVLLNYIEWGKEHYLIFGWTIFWTAIILATGIINLLGRVFFSLPNRILRSRNIKNQGWPPFHVDADGDVIIKETK